MTYSSLKVRSAADIKAEVGDLVKEYMQLDKKDFVPGKDKIPLSVPSFGWEEISEAIDSMLDTKVTMGEKVARFEEMFARYIGVKHAVMVNSGSSANLVALSILRNPSKEDHLQQRDLVITPALNWSTTVFSIIATGCVPLLVDVDIDRFTMSLDSVRKAEREGPRAVVAVHLLGNPCNMEQIFESGKEKDLFIVEDACEAVGAEINGRKVGSFGDLSTFSFFFSHHISTVEGGMLLTNNEEDANLARSMRAHGWIRERSDRREIMAKHDKIDPRFLFINLGYNLRPTEIQGAFGIHQMDKLEELLRVRRDNAEYWSKRLQPYSKYLAWPTDTNGLRSSWFGFPITVKRNTLFSRDELMRYLEEQGIETRPLMGGNMAEQPALKLFEFRTIDSLKNAQKIMRNSFFFGNHQGISQNERHYIGDCLETFLLKRNL